MKKKKRFNNKTFTKKWMDIIMVVALIDLQLPFVLALIGRSEIAETLGVTIVTEVIGIFLVYCTKSFFETKEAEKIRLKESELNLTKEQDNNEDDNEEGDEDYEG